MDLGRPSQWMVFSPFGKTSIRLKHLYLVGLAISSVSLKIFNWFTQTTHVKSSNKCLAGDCRSYNELYSIILPNMLGICIQAILGIPIDQPLVAWTFSAWSRILRFPCNISSSPNIYIYIHTYLCIYIYIHSIIYIYNNII